MSVATAATSMAVAAAMPDQEVRVTEYVYNTTFGELIEVANEGVPSHR